MIREAPGDGETAGGGDSFGGSFGGFPGGEAGGPDDGKAGGFGGFPGMSNQSVEETRNRNLITIGIYLGVILLCTAGILLFVRRK